MIGIFLYRPASVPFFATVKESEYFLLLTGEVRMTETFNKICNLLSEYGSFCREKGCDSAYLNEYCELLLSDNALLRLQASAN